MNEVVTNLPVIALRGMTILPYMVIHFDITRKHSIDAVDYAMSHGQHIFITAQDDEDTQGVDALDDVGVYARINQILKLPGNTLRVTVKGISRAKSLAYREDNIIFCNAELEDESETGLKEFYEAAMMRNLQCEFLEYVKTNSKITKETAARIMMVKNLPELIYRILAELPIEYDRKNAILHCDDMMDRYQKTYDDIKREVEIFKIRRDFMENVRKEIDKHQKEYVLREQLKIIRKELGEEGEEEADAFLEKAESLNAPDEVKEKLKKEIGRYRSMPPSSAEASVIRSYIELLLEMPWNNASEDNNSISNARKVLNKEHYGLLKVKERILEFLAVRQLKSDGEAPVICLVGPPGTGKTSIAASVANALGKKYVRISLGGVRDEAEIRGHRKTYVGAMPGRIAEGIRQAGVKNPLMLLDEVDKTGKDSRGDTASALLEVLDTAQNHRFVDHYLEVPIDLSQVLFIATANDASAIPRPLLDRMEIIELSSYTVKEKVHIAKDYLVKKQVEKNGLSPKELTISQSAIEALVQGYTREAGVRELERKIGGICRTTAKKLLEGSIESGKTVKVTVKNLSDFAGPARYVSGKADNEDKIGVVSGLAWTSVGGDTLTIEVNTMPGKGQMILTGNMGDVMKESARISLSYVRSVAGGYGVKEEFFEKNDIHIHIPEGAVPKDGPSAGITMSTAILSAVSKKPVKARLAMTGEVTLRGRVLAVGGLKEKLLAAGTYGIKEVLVPEANRRDIEQLEDEVKGSLRICYVENMKQVADYALNV